MIKLATQFDIDVFAKSAFFDRNIYPYMTTSKWTNDWKVFDSDWEGLMLTDDKNSFLLKVKFDRNRCEIEMGICLFAKSNISAGRACLFLKELIERYKPRAINSVVHATNDKSLKLHNKVFGQPWGIEPMGAWDSGKGVFVDAHFYRRLL